MQPNQKPPVFRFAPSPNGRLHLGHAYSALLNEKRAKDVGGKLLLRIEDIDRQRSKPEFEAGIYEDLNWLGIEFDEKPRRQSDHLPFYQKILDTLISRRLAYPSAVSRSEIASLAANDPNWPRDPDGALLPPVQGHFEGNNLEPLAIRLNMTAALDSCLQKIGWREAGSQIYSDAALWGDVVLKSRDGSFAYHLAVVADDALQNITHIVRGYDLYGATAIHRVLQIILGLPEPDYFHHALILDQAGEKLAKSRHSPTLLSMRQDGITPLQIRRQIRQHARQHLGFSA